MKRTPQSSQGRSPEVQTHARNDGPSFVDFAIANALRNARACHERGEHAEAQRLYRGVLVLDADHALALSYLGLLYDQTGDPAKAEPFLARAAQRGAPGAWTLTNHAGVLVKLGRHQQALDALSRALALDPNSAAAHLCSGSAWLGLERYAEAIAAFEHALSLHAGLGQAWCGRGIALHALKRPADALICYERALAIAPHDFTSLAHRGHALHELGQYEEALHAYRIALVVKPDMPDLLSAYESTRLALQSLAQCASSPAPLRTH